MSCAKKGEDIFPGIAEDAPMDQVKVEKMGWLMRLWTWLFKDKRSAWEQKQERRFIAAVNQLKNYSVTDRGGLSIDPEELRERVMASREELKHLVQPPSSNRTTHAPPFTTAPSTGHQGGSSPSASGMDDFVEVVTWRRLASGASVRYVCLESLTTKQYAVTSTDLFSLPKNNDQTVLDTKANQRIIRALNSADLVWFDSPSAAMDSFDASI
ncbi:hypothetical protein [Pseudomonas fluorescens]|uniref:hypothetical protein n=1 Tax=Pseudomonas fluorescens TaxID=294 RepID=UPI001BEA6C0D|nr:hypothetical protein [Pseudomonas fluorescens]MBT2371305.1 hypothetical protein [Pseudomonas fluorescens]